MSRLPETVLITGASAGIGAELARVFATHSFDLILVARRERELEVLAERYRNDHGVRVHVLPMDLLVPGAAARLTQRIKDIGLDIDVLVNNAGLMDMGRFAEIDVDRHVMRAPVDGIVDSRLFELGERPGIGQPVMVMLGGTQPHARVYVPEHLRVQIATGTQALMHIDGVDMPVEGQVRWVSSEAAFTPYFALTERDRGRLSFVAKVDILEERERLPDGVPVEVEFVLD